MSNTVGAMNRRASGGVMPGIGIWTARSLEWANQRDYLDQLFRVYPMQDNLKRSIPESTLQQLKYYYDSRDSEALVALLLRQDIFPFKDSYVAYLKRDHSALERNPRTLKRLSGMLYEMGLAEIINNISAPKETNRQIGPLFKNWLASNALGCNITRDESEFMMADADMIFLSSDTSMQNVAHKHLGYERAKGLDFLAKFQKRFILGEAKFLSDFGGHQTAQFNDAIATLESKLKFTDHGVIKIAILDGVVYIPARNKMHLDLLKYAKKFPIMSALVLRDYLYSL